MSLLRRLGLLGVLLVVAALAAPAATHAADPLRQLDASWTVTRPDGTPRDDGAIAVGDDLALSWTLVGPAAAIDYCQVQIWTVDASVWVPGNVDGSTCSVEMRLPDLPGNDYRHAFGGTYLDLCATAALILEAGGSVVELVEADRSQPGGRDCGPAGDTATTLDFGIDEDGGTDRPFVSDPPFLSWDVDDWDTGMGELRFGQPYTVAFPDMVAACTPYLNGSWGTTVRSIETDPCSDWVVRVPGVMPAGFDYGGHLVWDTFLVADYRMAADPEFRGFYHVETHMAVPIEPTDGIFESNQPAIFPTDLASARFVVDGETWAPTFQVSGIDAETCRMSVSDFIGSPSDTYDAPIDPATGQCTFAAGTYEADASRQYHVWLVESPLVTFAGDLHAIEPVPPPVVDPPTLEPDDDSVIDVESGGGQGLLVELSVVPVEAGGAAAGAAGAAVVAAAVETCSEDALTSDLGAGGGIPDFTTVCDLPPGTYTATATKLDVTGGTTTASGTFTVPKPRPRVTGEWPASGASGVPRDAHPTVTFDVPVSGVSGSTVKLVETATGSVVPATVTIDGAKRKATITPSALLKTSRQYRVMVSSGVTRADTGRSISPTSWTFTTTSDGTAPTIVGRTPGSGATLVPARATVAVRFSEPIKGASGTTLRLKDTVTGLSVPAVVAYDAVTRRATIDPLRVLVAGRRYQVQVRAGVADVAGNPHGAASWSFTVDPTDRRVSVGRTPG